LTRIIQFVSAKGEMMIAAHASRDEVSRWQAAMSAIYLAHALSGDSSGQLIWRVCEKTMFLAGSRIQASADAVDEFYRLCRGTRTEHSEDMGIDVDAKEMEQIEQWLADRQRCDLRAPLDERRN
jgi:hypothetical protein